MTDSEKGGGISRRDFFKWTGKKSAQGAAVVASVRGKIFLPLTLKNSSEDGSVLETPLNKLLRTSELTDSVSAISNGKNVTTDTRASADSSIEAYFPDNIQSDLAQQVAENGDIKGFNTAGFIVLSGNEQLPPELRFGEVGYNNNGQPDVVGKMASYKTEGKISVFFIPNGSLPINDASKMFKVNVMITDKFLRAVVTGDYLGNVGVWPERYSKTIQGQGISLIHK